MEDNKKDVSFAHDLIFFLQSCVSAEHHAIESYIGTKDLMYLQVADKIRRVRSKIMYRHIKESKAQLYCLSKHLMQMAQSQKEIGNRYTEDGETEFAKECFGESADWEAIFIVLNDLDKQKDNNKKSFLSEIKNKFTGGENVQSIQQKTGD